MKQPDDLILDAADEVAIRRRLVAVALGQAPADLAITVGRLFSAHARQWLEAQEIVVSGRRIAWVGPAGGYRGDVGTRVAYPDLAALPGFGEVHKHIESTHLTPEYEAALVIPHGNTWSCEASHDFANVNGPRNLEFWQAARRAGSPLKLFVLPGAAVPPSAWEETGGHYGHDEQRQLLAGTLAVAGLDEVKDWPALVDPAHPAHARIWGLIEATIAGRGVIEGHGAGLADAHELAAFAAAGLSSDHEIRTAEEAWERLSRGVFAELRPSCLEAVIPGLIARGLEDWSNVAFASDHRSASETLATGAIDHAIRTAIGLGLAPETAFQCATLNPARHMRVDRWVGALAPGRYADIVLVDDVAALSIAHVHADGTLAATGGRYVGPLPHIDWPHWASRTMNVGRRLTARDFALPALPGRATMQAAVLRPFHWHDDFLVEELPVADGEVQRDPSRLITKWAMVDRYRGDAAVAAMFWAGCGPADPDTALASSVAHDSHNIWVVGSSDAAMATAVNRLAEIGGGWVLVHGGGVTGEVRHEIGGLMTARPAEVLDEEMAAFRARANAVAWMHAPSENELWKPGFPEALGFATLTASPWRWVLVAQSKLAPEGLVNVRTGKTHKVVW